MATALKSLASIGAKFDVELRGMTAMRVGGSAECLITPESRERMLGALETCTSLGIPWRVLAKGSNVLIPDTGVPGVVVRTTSALMDLEVSGRYVRVGASVSLQKLINEAGKAGLGGIEYLYSVPGNVGGAIFMNAGRGQFFRKSIGDVVSKVEYWHRGRVKTIRRWRCGFAYRRSIFQRMPGAVILSVVLKMPLSSPEEVQRKVRDRMELVKKSQDNSVPNLGTVFRRHFENLDGIQGHAVGDAVFSTRTTNWILNVGQASSADVLSLVEFAKQRHREAHLKEPELEWSVW